MASAAAKTSPTITVCKSVAGSFRFSVNNRTFAMSGKCVTVKVASGVNHVSEIWAPASYRLSSISVSPAAARVSSSLKAATATVKLAASGAATVRFVSSKVIVQVPTQPTTPPPTDPPTGNPPVVNPQPVTLPAGNGYIEVCKSAYDAWVEGSFPFTITQGTTTIGTYTVAVGSCTGPIQVAAGTVSVAEGSEGPGYSLEAVTSDPIGDLGTVDLATQTASFTVTAGYETTANFIDATNVNTFKVCKTLTNNDGNLAGQTFDYNISWTFTPANGAAPISYPGSVNVVAVAAPGTSCTVVTNGDFLYQGVVPLGIPVGAKVWVNEGDNVPDVMVTDAWVTPALADAGSTGTTAVLTILPNPTVAGAPGGLADAMFLNDPQGFVEVCKYFDGKYSLYNLENSATFSVNGGAPIMVRGGQCSAPIEVPAGTATVSETIGASFYLGSISTISASDPTGARLMTTSTANPATVAVPYGDVGTETVVTFTNIVDPTQFKICKQETSSDAALEGATFKFLWQYKGNPDFIVGDPLGVVYLTIGSVAPGLVCSGEITGPAVVDPWNNPIPITITEESTSIPAVEATSIVYAGNGLVLSNDTTAGPVTVTGGTAGIQFDPGAGENVVTFTNGRTPGYVPPSPA